MKKLLFLCFSLFALIISFFCLSVSALDESSSVVGSSEVESSEYEISYSPQFSFEFNDNSLPEIFSWNPDDLENVIDVSGAIESLDPGIFQAAGAFNQLFSSLASVLNLSSLIVLLLVIGVVLALVGRL